MYDFQPIQSNRKTKRVEERSNEMTIDGKTISSQIDGYVQGTVTGSLLQPYEVETVQYLNSYGAEPIDARKGVREFTINYIMYNENRAELRANFNKLQSILNGEHVISFKDEKDWYYRKVWFTGRDSPVENRNNLVSSFTLTAHDPHRYANTLTTEEVVKLTGTNKVKPEEIVIQFGSTVNEPKIIVDNGQYETDFTLAGTVQAGTIVRVRIDPDSGKVTSSGAEIKLGSFPRNISLHNGARGWVKDNLLNTSVQFKYREVFV